MRSIHTILLALTTVCAFASCQKEDSLLKELPEGQTHTVSYLGEWSNTETTGRLAFFDLKFALNTNNTGQLNATYIDYNIHYPTLPVNWSTLPGDSLKIVFEFPDYPQDIWEIHVHNSLTSQMNGQYFRISKSDINDREFGGTIVLKQH